MKMAAPGDVAAELDRLLPAFQFTERHWTKVSAPADAAFEAIEKVDLSDSAIARFLQALWRIPAPLFLKTVPKRSMSVADFIPLSRKPPRYLVRGSIAGGGRRDWTEDEFLKYDGPGFKLAWGYTVTATDDGRARVDTETRVYCCDARTKRWFTVYWMIIRPWSGLIRRDLLRIARKAAEARLPAR